MLYLAEDNSLQVGQVREQGKTSLSSAQQALEDKKVRQRSDPWCFSHVADHNLSSLITQVKQKKTLEALSQQKKLDTTSNIHNFFFQVSSVRECYYKHTNKEEVVWRVPLQEYLSLLIGLFGLCLCSLYF